MNQPFDKMTAAILLAQVALHSPDNLRFVAQLLGWPACTSCDYVQQHCKCVAEGGV